MGFSTTTSLAKHIVKFTNRADGPFNVNIEGNGSLMDLDYADYSYMTVEISSKKLGVDKSVVTTKELKAELKNIAEKLTEFIGPEGASAFADII